MCGEWSGGVGCVGSGVEGDSVGSGVEGDSVGRALVFEYGQTFSFTLLNSTCC